MKKILFLRVAWMKRYRGHKSYDSPRGGGKYIDEHGDGGEVYNYLNVSGKAYAYSKPDSIDIKRIGASIKDDLLENVTVVWFAKNPDLSGQYIIGWFNNATVYKKKQKKNFTNERKGYSEYLVTAKYSDCVLIPENNRDFELFNPEPGQNFVWFGNEHMSDTKLKQVWTYINSRGRILPTLNNKRKSHKAFQQDIEKKKKVEAAAINTAVNYFENKRYRIKDVQSENKGWDIEAIRAGNKLNIEVKGLSGNQFSIELTTNEYTQFLKERKNYFLFVVRNALSNKQIINLFRCKNGRWVDYENNQLYIKEVSTASLSLK